MKVWKSLVALSLDHGSRGKALAAVEGCAGIHLAFLLKKNTSMSLLEQ